MDAVGELVRERPRGPMELSVDRICGGTGGCTQGRSECVLRGSRVCLGVWEPSSGSPLLPQTQLGEGFVKDGDRGRTCRDPATGRSLRDPEQVGMGSWAASLIRWQSIHPFS